MSKIISILTKVHGIVHGLENKSDFSDSKIYSSNGDVKHGKVHGLEIKKNYSDPKIFTGGVNIY